MLDSAARRMDALVASLPDSRKWFELTFAKQRHLVLALAFATFLTRASVFGDPAYHIDEAYYFLVGQRMQAGDLLYVDIWDRKPPGLYLLYEAFATISHQFWIVHLAAAVSACATAFIIYAIALQIANRQGALLASLCYLAMLPKFGGAGGQSPVFYNLLIAGSAWLIVSRKSGRGGNSQFHSELGAMLCAGLALTIKQTTLFEALFMGLWLVWEHWKEGEAPVMLAKRAAILAVAGAVPTLAYFAWYVADGNLAILWQSVVTSNFSRQYDPEGNNGLRLAMLAGQIGLPLGAAFLAVVLPQDYGNTDRTFSFATAWAIVSLAAVALFPNKFDHYMLPTLLPLAILGARFYGRHDFGLGTATILIVAFLIAGKCFDYRYYRQSIAEMKAAADIIRRGEGETKLFVYGDPVFLYAMSDAKPPAALAFPGHLYDRSERDVSPYKVEEQVRRALSARPVSVVVQSPLPAIEINKDIDAMVASYIASCRERRAMPFRDMYLPHTMIIYANCVGKVG